jgi:hypothetical protein
MFVFLFYEGVPVEAEGIQNEEQLERERIFQYFSATRGTRTVIIRLNYANEPRYGVLVDLTQKVLAGQTIDLAMGHVNVIWQGDANNYIARSLPLASSPA